MVLQRAAKQLSSFVFLFATSANVQRKALTVSLPYRQALPHELRARFPLKFG